MPTIKFKLKDPKYCNDCKMIKDYSYYGITCTFFGYINRDYNNRGCPKFLLDRPQACIDKFGE